MSASTTTTTRQSSAAPRGSSRGNYPEEGEDEGVHGSSDTMSAYLARVNEGFDNGAAVDDIEMGVFDQYDGVERLYVQKDTSSSLQDEHDMNDDEEYEATPRKRRNGKGRRRTRIIEEDEEEEDEENGDHDGGFLAGGDENEATPTKRRNGKGRQHQTTEGEENNREAISDENDNSNEDTEGVDHPITRAELVDYLDHRERIQAAVLERIERRLESIEERLDVMPSPPSQNQVIPEMGKRRRKRQSTKSDPRLRQFVRIHAAIMLGVRNSKHDGVPEPPSIAEIDRFSETGKHGPSNLSGEWRPDLNGPRKSSWNKAAARRFRRNFLKSRQYGDWTEEQVEKAIFVHMDTLRARYKDQMGQRSKDEHLRVNIKAARSSRLKSLIQQRLTACDQEEDLSSHLPYVKKLAEEGGISGDESDNHRAGNYKGQVKYYRVRPIWRAPAISSWLDVIDKVYVAYRFQQNQRATPGNWIRKRYDINRVDEKARAVPGLPQNFYDEDWLKTLDQKKKKKLKMAPPVDLEHTGHIMRIALRYSNIKKRTDMPEEVETEEDSSDAGPGGSGQSGT